ncbi:unnamed protein product [Penicillium camemberti]|uniref:Str. FM013 n=1 Tax=Penicillium camemberti (strain FM 013) TaxID=1429867 RepID=A0A0G4NUS4_PENC3|nr:unnamed protein product [Penicillium camemberti]
MVPCACCPFLSSLTGGGYNISSHLLVVPAIAPKVQAVIEDTSRGSSTKDLEGWLTVHCVRT